MDNHFNNDETRRVPLPGSEPSVPEQFTPEHFDDDREPEQPQKQPKRRRSRRQMNAGCAGSMVYMIAVVGVSLVLSIAALFMANDIFAFVKADAGQGDHGFGEHLGILARQGAGRPGRYQLSFGVQAVSDAQAPDRYLGSGQAPIS